MTHESTWLARTHVLRRMRSMAAVGTLLACILLAGLADTASATTYDIRGEWSIELTASKQPPLSGSGLITKLEPGGEFTGNATFAGILPATLSGTVSSGETSFTVVATTPGGVITFIAPAATIESVKNEFTGPGTYYTSGTPFETGAVVAKRLRSYQEILEQEEREQREREEKLAREAVRGEWALVLKVGPQTTNAIALITQEANPKNEFASTSALFESVVPGSFSGTLEGGKATVTVTTEAYGSIPASKFTSSTMTVNSGGNSFSMSGTGTFVVTTPGGPLEAPGELAATRLHTYAEVKERETQEEEAKEQQEREAAEAKAAKEAREAKESEEARLKQAREAAEKLAREAKPLPSSPGGGNVLPLASAAPAAKTFTIGGSGSLALGLTNPNAFAIQGRITLLAGGTGHASRRSAAKAKKKGATISYGTASFTIAPHGSEVVKIKLSRSARADLTRHKARRLTVTIATSASGMSGISKTYTITLHAPASHHRKG